MTIKTPGGNMMQFIQKLCGFILLLHMVVFATYAGNPIKESKAEKFSVKSGDKSNVVFYQGFEGGMPSGWNQQYISSPDNWDANWNVRTGAGFVTGSYTGDPDTAAVGTKNLAFQFQGIGHITRIITPAIDLEFIVNPVLSFYHAQAEWDPGQFDNLVIYYRKGENGEWKFLRGYMHAVETWTQREISLTDHDTDKFYLALEGISGYGFGVLIDEFTITETGIIPKELNNISTDQASLEFIPNGSVNNPILRTRVRVTGNSGSLPLTSYTAHSLNTNDDDIANVKLYFTESEHFNTSNLIAGSGTFQNGAVTFHDLDHELPTGYSYLWLVYDVSMTASHGNIADAYIPANGITIAGQQVPADNQSPHGSRPIFQTVFYDNFDTDKGWILTGEWERAAPQGLGGSHGLPGAFYPVVGTKILGTDITGLGNFPGDYEPGLDTLEYIAISPSIDCFYYRDIILSFDRWLNTEPADLAWIHISTDEGASWEQIWVVDNHFGATGWTKKTYQLPSANRQPQLRIRFGLGPTDNSNNYSGWNIDNVVVTGTYVTHDVGVTQWIGPDGACGMSSSEQIVVRVQNFGSLSVNQPIPIGFSLDGGQNWHMDTIYQPMIVGQSVLHTFQPGADFSVPARYDHIMVKTFWDEDQDPDNDILHHALFSEPYVSIPYSEFFIASDGLWSAKGANSSWEWNVPAGDWINESFAGERAWFTNPQGVYNVNEASWLESPCFNLSGSDFPVMEFNLFTHTPEALDGLGLQYTLDEGLSWNPIPMPETELSWNWFDADQPIEALEEKFNSGYGWHGDNGGWTRVRAVLGDDLVNAEKVKFRWVFASGDLPGEGFSWEGIGFDAFALYEAPYDVGVTQLVTPQDACELSAEQSVTLEITNFGLNTIPHGTVVPAAVDINTDDPVQESFVLEEDLQSGSSVQFTFATHFDLSEETVHQIVAYTLMPGDNDFYNPGVFNDTLTAQITVFGYTDFYLGDDIYTTRPDTVILDAGPGFEHYLWQDNTTDQTFTVTSNHSATYWVTVTDHNGCPSTGALEVSARDIAVDLLLQPLSSCSLSDSETVVVQLLNTGPDAYHIGTEIPLALYLNGVFIEDTLVVLSQEFPPQSTLNVIFAGTIDLSLPGSYSVEIIHSLTDADPVNNAIAAQVVVFGFPQPNIGDTIYTLTPAEVILDAGAGYEAYLWQDGYNQQFYSPEDPFSAWYTVTVTDEHGCQGTDSVYILTYDIEIAGFIDPLEACELSDNQSVEILLINHGPEVLYAGRKFPFVLEFDQLLASTDTLILSQDWQPGEELYFLFSAPVDMHLPGDYLLSVYQQNRDANTLNDTLIASVTVHGFPDVSLPDYIASEDPEGIILEPGAGYHAYLWHDGSTGETFTVQTWGLHWVEVANVFGCTSNASTFIYPEISDLSVDSILVSPAICAHSTGNIAGAIIKNSGYVDIPAGIPIGLYLEVNGSMIGYHLLTLDDAFQAQTSFPFYFAQTFAAAAEGTLEITITAEMNGDENPENNTLSKYATILPLPQPCLGDDIYSTDPVNMVLCPGDDFASYQWQDGSDDHQYIITTNESATYNVTVSDANGCFNSASVDVITYEFRLDDILLPKSHCVLTQTEEVTLKIYNHGVDDLDAGYVISLGFGLENQLHTIIENFVIQESWPANTYKTLTFSHTIDLSTGSQFDFMAFVATPNAEMSSDTLVSLIEITGKPQVNLGQDIYTSRPDTIMLDAGPGFASYYWQDGHNQQTYQVNSFGWKWVRVTDQYGCHGADTLYVGFFADVPHWDASPVSRVYPNPSGGNVTLEIEHLSSPDVVVEITDMHGRRIFIHHLENESGIFYKTFNLNTLPAGLHFLTVTAGQYRKTHRILLQY